MKRQLVWMVLAAGCGNVASREEARPQAKVEAAVDVALSVSGKQGAVVLAVDVLAQQALPRVVLRVVVPAGVVLGGPAVQELGAMAAGTVRHVELPAQVGPDVAGAMAAGVDVVLASGVTLHKSAQPVVLGPPPVAKQDVMKVDGQGVRMGRAQ